MNGRSTQRIDKSIGEEYRTAIRSMPRGKHIKPEIGANTQFGKPGAVDPKKATKMGVPKWSIRKHLAYFAAQNIDVNDPKAMRSLLGNNPTIAQVIAAALLTKASKGHTDAINSAMENIDGKLKQPLEHMGPDGQPLPAAQTSPMPKRAALHLTPDLLPSKPSSQEPLPRLPA